MTIKPTNHDYRFITINANDFRSNVYDFHHNDNVANHTRQKIYVPKIQAHTKTKFINHKK